MQVALAGASAEDLQQMYKHAAVLVHVKHPDRHCTIKLRLQAEHLSQMTLPIACSTKACLKPTKPAVLITMKDTAIWNHMTSLTIQSAVGRNAGAYDPNKKKGTST